jgi:hypothetical protein
VAPSARSRSGAQTVAGVAAVVTAAGLLAGCVSTQDKAARLRINADRIRASQVDTRVTVANPEVTVTGVVVVAAGRQAAFVVTVRDDSDRPRSDLPISVGYRGHARGAVYLNADADLDYFSAHLPVIAAHRSLTWVSAPTHRLPRRVQPFAIVGVAPSVPGTTDGSPPALRVGAGAVTDGRLTVRVRNLSGIPQYQLPVYAVAQRDGRTTAAGAASVKELDGGATQTLRLPLLGRIDRAPVQLETAATILH